MSAALNTAADAGMSAATGTGRHASARGGRRVDDAAVDLVTAPRMDAGQAQGLRQLLADAGMRTSAQASLRLAGIYDYIDGEPAGTDGWPAYDGSVVRIARQGHASLALAADLGVELAAAVLAAPPPSTCTVRLTLPARLRAFAPALALPADMPAAPAWSGGQSRLRRSVPGFRSAAAPYVPAERDVLADGRIAFSVLARDGAALPPLGAEQRWAMRLLHVLAARWSATACACCASA